MYIYLIYMNEDRKRCGRGLSMGMQKDQIANQKTRTANEGIIIKQKYPKNQHSDGRKKNIQGGGRQKCLYSIVVPNSLKQVSCGF